MAIRNWAPRFVVVVALSLTVGCMTGKKTDRAFSNDWLNDYKTRKAFEERKQRLRPEEELIIAGEPDSARASVYMDEEGDPKVNLGIPEGISADIDIDTDEAEMALKYKMEWGKPKKNIRETAPKETLSPE